MKHTKTECIHRNICAFPRICASFLAIAPIILNQHTSFCCCWSNRCLQVLSVLCLLSSFHVRSCKISHTQKKNVNVSILIGRKGAKRFLYLIFFFFLCKIENRQKRYWEIWPETNRSQRRQSILIVNFEQCWTIFNKMPPCSACRLLLNFFLSKYCYLMKMFTLQFYACK